MIPAIDIAPPDAVSVEAVLRRLVAELVAADQLAAAHAEATVRKLLDREELGATNIGRGIAVPNVVDPSFQSTVIIAGRLPAPLHWGSDRDAPADRVYLVLAPDQAGYLRSLELIASDM